MSNPDEVQDEGMLNTESALQDSSVIDEPVCDECDEMSSSSGGSEQTDIESEGEVTSKDAEQKPDDGENTSETATDYSKCLEEMNGKLDYICDAVYKLYGETKNRMISQEVMAQFDRTIKEQMQDIKLSATKTLLCSIADLRERVINISFKMKESRDTMTVDKAINNIDIFESMLEELLVMNGFVPFSDEVGEIYQYPKHNKIKLIDTDDESLNKTIAKVHRNGYMYGDAIMVPQSVDVYRYVKKEE